MGIWLQKWFERAGHQEYGDRGIAAGGASELEGWVWSPESLKTIEEEAMEYKYPMDLLLTIQGDWVKLWFPQWN